MVGWRPLMVQVKSRDGNITAIFRLFKNVKGAEHTMFISMANHSKQQSM